jgi:glycosyltransferase involved in cell wall biosynthesis
MTADMIKISIVIPTFDRNKQLERALESCVQQQAIAVDDYEIVVVDNSPDERARPLVARLAAQHSVAMLYISERRPGISFARNTGVASARGELVAFLDDDGEAHEDWLRNLWSTYRKYDPDVIWGALLPRFDGDLHGWDWFFNEQLTRPVGKTGARPNKLHGTNNSCIRRTAFPLSEPFPPELGLLGGGDIAFFRKLEVAGRKFTYCAEAIVFDHFPAERTSYRYLLTRCYWQGQVTTYMYAIPGMRSSKMVMRSLIAGVVGIVRFGGIAAGQLMLGRPQAAALTSLKIARAVGRLMWIRPFRKQRYGTIGPPQTAPVAAEVGE